MNTQQDSQNTSGLTLVLGGTGKTGRRIAASLEEKGVPVRIGSRSAYPPFDWHHETGWDACLQDVEAVYITPCPAKVVSIRQPAERWILSGLDRSVRQAF